MTFTEKVQRVHIYFITWILCYLAFNDWATLAYISILIMSLGMALIWENLTGEIK